MKFNVQYNGGQHECEITMDQVDRLVAFYYSVQRVAASSFYKYADPSMKLKVDLSETAFTGDLVTLTSAAPIIFTQGAVDEEHWDAFLVRLRHVCLNDEPGFLPGIVGVLCRVLKDKTYKNNMRARFTQPFLNSKPDFMLSYTNKDTGTVELYDERFFQDYLNAFYFHSAPDIREKFRNNGFDLEVGRMMVQSAGMVKADVSVHLANYVFGFLKTIACL